MRKNDGLPRYDANGVMTKTYNSWRSMKKRCQWPGAKDWDRYGGLGIKVCSAWQTYAGFVADMGIRPEGKTLDRINPFGNYEPGNCRWATPQEQAANKRPKN